MGNLRAVVRKGRLLLNEPTSLPEGTVLDLVVDDESDTLSDTEREALNTAIAEAWESAKAGHVRPASEILAELRARSQ